MEWSFALILFIFGTLFGSFSSVIISRLRSGEGGIMTGRSHCIKCNHTLGAFDLIPIFSWFFSFGKCRYCKTKVSVFYPILEICMGLCFAIVGAVLVNPELIMIGEINEIIKLIFLLTTTFFTFVYVVYDILYMEIPDSALAILNIIAFIILIYATTGTSLLSTFEAPNWLILGLPYELTIIGTSLIGGIIIAGLYTIMFWELDSFKKDLIKDLGILTFIGLILLNIFKSFPDAGAIPMISGVTASYFIFSFFYLLYALSGGKAIGGGDFRIAINMGLLLGLNYIFLGGFLAYFLGSIIAIIYLCYQGYKKYILKKETTNKIAFGPFLALGTFSALLFHSEILELYDSFLGAYYSMMF